MKQTTISLLERGKVPDPRLSTVTLLARGLRISLAEAAAAINRSVEEHRAAP